MWLEKIKGTKVAHHLCFWPHLGSKHFFMQKYLTPSSLSKQSSTHSKFSCCDPPTSATCLCVVGSRLQCFCPGWLRGPPPGFFHNQLLLILHPHHLLVTSSESTSLANILSKIPCPLLLSHSSCSFLFFSFFFFLSVCWFSTEDSQRQKTWLFLSPLCT